jgi:uncharacterized protein YlxP (DUF503 family)
MGQGDRMVVGVLKLELIVLESNSLKDKRRVVKSIKERLMSRFSASVAEVGGLDSWRRCVLGAALASNDPVHTHSLMDKMVGFVRGDPRVSLVKFEKETR